MPLSVVLLREWRRIVGSTTEEIRTSIFRFLIATLRMIVWSLVAMTTKSARRPGHKKVEAQMKDRLVLVTNV
jgi:hypothetical protein